jgi:histidine phosphotransfer protein HptB
MDEPVVERAAYMALQERVGAEFAAELVDTFVEEAVGLFAELRSAYREPDAARFRRAAHSLKSNGETFGAKRFAALARELELNGVDAVDANALAVLEAEYQSAIAALNELRDA